MVTKQLIINRSDAIQHVEMLTEELCDEIAVKANEDVTADQVTEEAVAETGAEEEIEEVKETIEDAEVT
jgi:hypothetical protein